MNDLDNLAIKYGTDKYAKHRYTAFYYELLKFKRESFKKILEIGVGEGQSLRMWRDFFPNAQVYGADIAKEAVFKDERLETFRCDERDKSQVEKLIEKIGSDIDLVIDDASHHVNDQIFLCKTLMPLLKKDVIYIIEDCRHTRAMRAQLSEYDFFIPALLANGDPKMHDRLYVVTNKK